ncbi:DUF4192 family protein [Streptomyces sp. MST-110588]|nr:DUF4192 family protein [Streptomyces sp. MST-110588]
MSDEPQVTLRSPAELADALPYLLGFYPDDSIVLVALHGPRGRFGGRVRLGIPADRTQWPYICDQLASCLITAGEQRGRRPDGVIVYLCREPREGETGRDVMERLRPLAQRLRTACGSLDVPVLEALCISRGRYWSYCCPDFRCCPVEGSALVMPGTSVMAAAAAFAGVQVGGSLREMEARLTAHSGPRAGGQEKALDATALALIPRMLRTQDQMDVRKETLDLAARLVHRFREDPPTGSRRARDACDDALLADGEAAQLILGLQDRAARDQAATRWMEGADAEPALRLWRALSRRCVNGYTEHAVAPLALAGWAAWSTDDEPAARVALGRALSIDPEYLFAQLLHHALNEGLDPELLRRCLREADQDRPDAPSTEPVTGSVPPPTGSLTLSTDSPLPTTESVAPPAGALRPKLPRRNARASESAGPGRQARAGRPTTGRPTTDRPGGPRARTRPDNRPGTRTRTRPRTGAGSDSPPGTGRTGRRISPDDDRSRQ